MKAMRLTALLILAVVSLLLQPPPGAGTGAAAQGNQPAAALAPRTLVINEVAPIPSGDGHEWVELVNLGGGGVVYMPLVLRAYRPGASSVARPGTRAGEAGAPLGGGLDLSGWQISDEDGNNYTIPAALGPVPREAYVLILFDGQGPGADDYDLSDGLATLHSPAGLVDIFEDSADQVALYAGSGHSAATLHDFVAYGALPGADGNRAVAAGLWGKSAYVADTEQIPGAVVLAPGGSLGLLKGHRENGPDDWAIYTPVETTPGEANPAPAPYFRTPPDGIKTTDRRIPFGWSTVDGATSYQLQLGSDASFASIVIDQTVTETTYIPDRDLSDGSYYYRARARNPDGSYSSHSPTYQVTIIPGRASAKPGANYRLNVEPQLQHKDSRMICVDGHRRSGNDRWDSAHEDDGDWQVGNGKPLRTNLHDNWYCTRASIAMIVDYHGGALSQDRISYHTYDNDGDPPEGDLGHGKGLWPDKLCSKRSGTVGDDDVFTWAMNGGKIDCGRGKPSFSQIKTWIDAERPVLIVENDDAHSVVLDGYNTEGELAHRIDPWTATASWVDYSSWNISEYHCPVADKTPRSNEDEFYRDSDLDGLTDFDEMYRLGTSHLLADTDDDWVEDKWDLAEVYFTALGFRSKKQAGADMDGDGFRKEEDWDNDGGGAWDGCEDANQNGKRDAGETSNFFAGDDISCVPTLDDRYAADLMLNRKSPFRPGEAIALVMVVTNNTAKDLPAQFSWRVEDPNGKEVTYLTMADVPDSLLPGTERYWLASAIHKNAPKGECTYRGTLTYRGQESSSSASFLVQGDPIPIGLARTVTCLDVVDTLFVDGTDTFTPLDEKAVVWTAWEGAWGSHTVKYKWYLPDGTFFFEHTESFTTNESWYKTWSWIEGAGLYKTGLWKVEVYLDDTYVKTVEFTVTEGARAMPLAAPLGTVVGGGSGQD